MSLDSRSVGGGDGIKGGKEQGQGVPFFRHVCEFWRLIPLILFGFRGFSVDAADGSLTVGFEQPQYQVNVGQAFSVNVALPPLPNGLFSYGIRLNLPAGKVVGSTSDAAVVPLPINFNGTAGPGALRQITTDMIGVKGTVNFDAVLEPYKGALLTTFNLKNQAGVGETYTLTLDLFRTLGPTETVFVDGLGVNLDSLITFGSASVTVVPEPSLAVILALPLAWKLVSRFTEKGTRA
jgi:hypothetical protein